MWEHVDLISDHITDEQKAEFEKHEEELKSKREENDD